MDPIHHVPRGSTPFYMVGTDDRPLDTRVVAVAIAVRADVKVADRDFSAPVCIHEIPVLQRYLEAMTGSCTLRINGGWPPGLPRFRRLTQDNLRTEVRRLSARVVPLKDRPPLEPFSSFFPGTEDEKVIRLHKVMKEQLEAWTALAEKAIARISPEKLRGIDDPEIHKSLAADYITEQEVMTVANMADASRRELAEIVLPGVDDVLVRAQALAARVDAGLEAIKAAAAVADPTEAVGDLVTDAFSRMKEVGFADAVAVAVSALLEPHGREDMVPDEAIISAGVDKAKLAAARRALKG
jgi:hypothetical protein